MPYLQFREEPAVARFREVLLEISHETFVRSSLGCLGPRLRVAVAPFWQLHWLFFVVAILGILSFAILRGSGTTDAFNRLEPGMSPTEVAALLGVPRAESAQGGRIIQTWKIPDGQIFEVVFRDGKLIEKRKREQESAEDRQAR